MRTKIIATLGPASMEKDTMRAMVEQGVRIFRLNFSHSDAEFFKPVVSTIRELENEMDIPLTAMGDLCGPKTRIGEVAGSPLTVPRGTTVLLGLPDQDWNTTTEPFISLDFPELLAGLEQGMPVSLSDGMLQFIVAQVIHEDRLFRLEAQNSGMLTSHKGIAFPGKFHPMPALTDKDRKDLHEGLDIGLDALALSFVQTRKDLEDIKAEIERHGTWVPVVAKLERKNALDNLDAILEVADAVMVARGDLGLECSLVTLPVIQKRIIRACRHAQKAAIVATQMLLSMVKNPLPTRAETTDVANAVMDGADCVMLSEETAIGTYPVEACRFIHGIAAHAEEYMLERLGQPYAPAKDSSTSKYFAYSACLLAQTVAAKGVVCHSTSGKTGRLLASRRGPVGVHMLTPSPSVVRYLNYFFGVSPTLVEDDLPSHLDRVERYIEAHPEFESGDDLVITSGQPTPGQPKRTTNLLKLYTK